MKKKRFRSVQQAFQLLAGQSEPAYALEPALKLFQVKYWLTSRLEPRKAMLLSGRMLGAAVMHHELEQASGSTSQRLRTIFRDREKRALFDHVFSSGQLFTTKQNVGDLERACRRRLSDSRFMEYWIEIARIQVLLERQFEYSTLANAEVYMAKRKSISSEYKSFFPGSRRADENKRSKDKYIFLLSARLTCPNLLEFQYRGSGIISSLQNEMPSHIQFRSFCGLSRSLHELLGEKGSEFLDRYLGELREGIPEFERVPEEWELEFARPLRMKPTETSKGKASRQKAVHQS